MGNEDGLEAANNRTPIPQQSSTISSVMKKYSELKKYDNL
jgi:hypothetical protein